MPAACDDVPRVRGRHRHDLEVGLACGVLVGHENPARGCYKSRSRSSQGRICRCTPDPRVLLDESYGGASEEHSAERAAPATAHAEHPWVTARGQVRRPGAASRTRSM